MLDVREIYGVSPWQRERFDLLAEEAVRLAQGTHAASQFTATPVQVVETSQDGHSATLQPVTKLKTIDPTTGQTSYEDHTPYVDTPVHFAGGGGVTATHPIAKGDEGIILHAARDFDAWRQSGGTQQPMDNGVNNAGNALHIPGVRSDPRKLQQVSTEAHHVRSDDKLHVQETHPQNGHRTFSADPSTAPASASFDPLSMASKFVDHAVRGTKGLLARAVSGGTTHDHGIDFGTGPFMRAANALHTMLCHAQNGPSMNAQNALHQVLASPALGAMLSSANGKNTVTATIGGVMLQSPTSISFACPPGGLGLPAGAVGSSALASGAASQNVGAVGGDVSGTLPTLNVVGIGNVDATNLPRAANDSAAAAAGVALNHLYVNTGAVSGVGLLAVRLA